MKVLEPVPSTNTQAFPTLYPTSAQSLGVGASAFLNPGFIVILCFKRFRLSTVPVPFSSMSGSIYPRSHRFVAIWIALSLVLVILASTNLFSLSVNVVNCYVVPFYKVSHTAINLRKGFTKQRR
jgi:hypothetical protein